MKKLEKRKMRRFSKNFVSLEERDRFLSERFPNLKATEKPGYYLTPQGGKLSVWNEKVIWNEPHAQEA